MVHRAKILEHQGQNNQGPCLRSRKFLLRDQRTRTFRGPILNHLHRPLPDRWIRACRAR
jgi:hypothetical protein